MIPEPKSLVHSRRKEILIVVAAIVAAVVTGLAVRSGALKVEPGAKPSPGSADRELSAAPQR